jgi:hypothetical protein
VKNWWAKNITTMHRNKIYFCVTSVLFTLQLSTSSTILMTETVSGQMMGSPNLMYKEKMAMGSGLNYTKGENITG